MLISKEQRHLEETLTQLQEDVTSNTKVLKNLEDDLLYRLSNVQGSLLDDPDIIDVLANIKLKSKEVTEKLKDAGEKKIEINEKREQFRPCASRGAVLYFNIVEMTQINNMYNSSLQQFTCLYYWSIDNAAPAPITKDRVCNIRDELTRKVYRYVNRGIFERDKITFKLMMATSILRKEGKLNNADVGLLLKAGGGIDDKNNPFKWMQQSAWLNLKALSKHKFCNEHTMFFKELPDKINRQEQQWQAWYESDEPENMPIPDYEDKISGDQNIGPFIHLCLVRCLRTDRTVLASNQFIKETLGPYYVSPVTDQPIEIFVETAPNVPVLYLLSTGADPTGTIDALAQKKKKFPTA